MSYSLSVVIAEARPFAQEEYHLNEESDEDSSLELDCPICLESMKKSDCNHPLQCARRCGYNFCRTCIQSLINSSKDDYMEASDGNTHVKVFLHCPNCRSDLSESIRDTVLLRRADSVESRLCDDEELTDEHLRMYDAMQDDHVKKVIDEARAREAEFFGELKEESSTSEDSQDDAAWGVEADLIHGVHQSFHYPQPIEVKAIERELLIDTTLFGGLAYFMTEDQQETVTDMLTSGNPSKLADAAEMLLEISKHSRTGKRRSFSHRSRSEMNRRGSVYKLIAEAAEAHAKAELRDKPAVNSSPWPVSKAARLKQMEIERRQEAEYLRSHPLPVRMPKCIELTLDADKELPLTFCNDVWDGTVMDAFCKLTIRRGGRVTKNTTRHAGVRSILDGDGPVRIDVEKSRILVASFKGNCGRQGIMKGDVVTHLNGSCFEGDAEALVTAIQTYLVQEESEAMVKLVFNCGRPIAEALKRRSLVE